MAINQKDEIKLMAIKLNSWKRIDQDKAFDAPENVYIINRNVNLPWNSKFDHFSSNLYDPAKI